MFASATTSWRCMSRNVTSHLRHVIQKMANIKVAVRVRPFNDREQENETAVNIENKTVIITDLRVPSGQDYDHRQRVHQFTYDYCYWSATPTSSKYATQEQVYNELGRNVLKTTLDGYNCCLFAYGQSGSGKTYSMIGNTENPGLIPLLCQELFQAKFDAKRLTFRMDFSCMEIYNEKVYDLLYPTPTYRSMRIREHPIHGPYVDGISQHIVQDENSLINLFNRITENRNKSNTQITKSRSHTVFTVKCNQVLMDDTGFREVNSKLHLVDLAASERADLQYDQIRLKEGSNINKSLTTLGIVIASLASPDVKFVPYRDSVLTWLLKDSLGGNSYTFMLANISPSVSCCSETISTLRYAQRVKTIINHPVVNEAPAKNLLHHLKCEVDQLKEILVHKESIAKSIDVLNKLKSESNSLDSLENCEDKCSTTWLTSRKSKCDLSSVADTSDLEPKSERSNLSTNCEVVDRVDTNSSQLLGFRGKLTSNYLVILRDKFKQENREKYQRLPFKLRKMEKTNKRLYHSDTDLSVSKLSQNFALFRAAIARGNKKLPPFQFENEIKLEDGRKSCNFARFKFSDKNIMCDEKDKDIIVDRVLNETISDLDYSVDSLREDSKVPSVVSDLNYSTDSLIPNLGSKEIRAEEADDDGSSSASTESITFVFMPKENSPENKEIKTEGVSPRTLSIDSLFAEKLLTEFRDQPICINDNSDDGESNLNYTNADNWFESTSPDGTIKRRQKTSDVGTQTVQSSDNEIIEKVSHFTHKSGVKNKSLKDRQEGLTSQLVQLMSDVISLLKSGGSRTCKCNRTCTKNYLRHLVEFRKQMVASTLNKRQKCHIVSQSVYSCFSSDSSTSGGFSSSSYLSTHEKDKSRPYKNTFQQTGSADEYKTSQTKWRSDSGAVCTSNFSSEALTSPDIDEKFPVMASCKSTLDSLRKDEVEENNLILSGTCHKKSSNSLVSSECPQTSSYLATSTKTKFTIELDDLFPEDSYLSLPTRIANYT